MRPRSQEIEYRVRRIVEAVERGEPIEDDLVELKSEWLRDHHKAARRIAGHANAARGEGGRSAGDSPDVGEDYQAGGRSQRKRMSDGSAVRRDRGGHRIGRRPCNRSFADR